MTPANQLPQGASKMCEACESVQASIVDTEDDETSPYILCHECHQRLEKRALRPMEWYRLALLHSPHQFRLHDDFYDDSGHASQPKIDVVDASLFPAPLLEEKAQNIEDLWEFSLTRYVLGAPIYNAWMKLSPTDVREFICRTYDNPKEWRMKRLALEIAENCLGNTAADLVRRAWCDYPKEIWFGAIAEASMACLPPDEAFHRSFEAFRRLPLKEKRQKMMYMRGFRRPEMLDWIETNIEGPITNDWGYLAASSGFTWKRATKWLAAGRPLSIVALDALIGVAATLEGNRPALHCPIIDLPDRDEVESTLKAHLASDTAARAEGSVNYILEYYHFLGPQNGQ